MAAAWRQLIFTVLLLQMFNWFWFCAVDLSGPVKNFYERVPFQKMVSYSVRSRVSLTEDTRLSDG